MPDNGASTTFALLFDLQMTTETKADQWLQWAEALAVDDFVVIDHFLPDTLLTDVRAFFQEQLDRDYFDKAGIGSALHTHVDKKIRGDYTFWLQPERDRAIAGFFTLMDEAMQWLNRLCFLSLSDYEFHLAYYPAGTGYRRHLDRHRDHANRMISMVLYFNPDWQPDDGGALQIEREDGSLLIEPILNRLVMFKSADVWHEVLPTTKPRYSLTGWLLYQPASLGYLLG